MKKDLRVVKTIGHLQGRLATFTRAKITGENFDIGTV